MEFDVNAAKQAGHSDADIARIQKGIEAARAAGRTDEEIQQYLQSGESSAKTTTAEDDAAAQAQADYDKAQSQAAASTPSEIAGAAKGFVRGAGRGLSPERRRSLRTEVTSAINAPTRMDNAGVRPEGEGFVTDETPPAVQKPLGASAHPDQRRYNPGFPAGPEFHPIAEFVGGVAASAIIEAGLTGGASLAALPATWTRLAALPMIVARNTGRAAATTGGQISREQDRRIRGREPRRQRQDRFGRRRDNRRGRRCRGSSRTPR